MIYKTASGDQNEYRQNTEVSSIHFSCTNNKMDISVIMAGFWILLDKVMPHVRSNCPDPLPFLKSYRVVLKVFLFMQN